MRYTDRLSRCRRPVCFFTANNTKRSGNAAFLDSIMICQSMSGSAANVIPNGYTLCVNGVALTGTK